MSTKTTDRLGFVDALRGFAALFVVFYHIVFFNVPAISTPSLIAPLLYNGWSGVPLFFVVSAFTLCYTLQGGQNDQDATLKFYLRRLFRILPLYYLWFIAMFIINRGNFYLSLSALLSYLGFGYNFLPGRQEGVVWASWTLGIEMIFYLIFPFLFRVVRNLKAAIIFLIITLALSYAHHQYFTDKAIAGYKINVGIAAHLPVFAVGMITFYVFGYLKKSGSRYKSARLFAVGATLFFSLPYLFEYVAAGWYTRTYTMTAVYAIIFISLTISRVSFFSNRLILFLGTISYSIYLNHLPIIIALRPVYSKVYAMGRSNYLSLALCFVITVLPVVVLSCLTYHLIEKPGIALGKNLINKLSVRRRETNRN